MDYLNGYAKDLASSAMEEVMILFFVFAGILTVPLGIYLYILIRRFLGLFLKDQNGRLQKIISVIAAIVIAARSVNFFGLWALIVFHVAAVSLLVDIIRLFLKRAGCRFSWIWEWIWRSGVIAFAVTAAVMGYAYVNMHRVIVTNYTIQTDKPIREGGYQIVFLSDLHYGTTMGLEKLQEYCKRMEQEQPDLVVLGGDIVDERTSLQEADEAFRNLGQIPSTFGTFYVYGNHDKGRYSNTCDFTEEQLEKTIQDAGVQILEDESVLLNQELSISGRKDRSYAAVDTGDRKTPADLIEELPQTAYHIVADHQPRDMQENAAAGYDLMLSGHTHAGQMWPVGLITTLFDKGTVNYGQKLFDNMQLIVSSGIAGWGYPLRTGKHSEYVVIFIK